MSMTKKALLTAGAVVALATGLPGGQAQALPAYCTGAPLNFPSGSAGPLPLSDFSGGACVQAQDKIFGGFVANTALPGNAAITLSLNTPVPGTDLHGFTMNGSFVGSVAVPVTYGYSFDITDTKGPFITALDGDFTQSALSGSTSTLTKTTTPAGNNGTATPGSGIFWQKTGNVPNIPPSHGTISYAPGLLTLAVTDSLVSRDDVSSIIDTVVETIPRPERVSRALVGTGLLGLGILRRRGWKR